MRTKVSWLLLLCLITGNSSADVLDDLIIKKKPVANRMLIQWLSAGLDDDTENKNPRLAQEICEAGARDISLCSSTFKPETLAEGICMAGASKPTDCTFSSFQPETIPEGICIAGGLEPSECTYSLDVFRPSTVAEAICIAGGLKPSECTYSLGSFRPKTPAEALCMAGGVKPQVCTYGPQRPSTVEQALALIPYRDRTYWWDRYRDQYGNYQWRCRGGQTKQFAENWKCSSVRKDDNRWPG